MRTLILKSKPYSMFRLGSGSLEETDKVIHSDTLFSAIINIYSKVYDNVENFIELFDNGSIKISSAFPMLMNDSNSIFFLPKPELNYNTEENIKTEKKIKFISVELFNSFKNAEFEKFSFVENATIIGSSFAVSKSEIDSESEITSFIKEVVTPKTMARYEKQENNFYHETDIQLLPISINGEKYFPNFYFLYELSCDEEMKKRFLTCVRLLADEGIGGERSTGKGHFEKIIENEIDIESANNQNQLLLSLFNPQNQEEFDSVERYEIIVRGGGSVSFDSNDDSVEEEIKPYRKKQVRMISEGAVLNNQVDGRLVDVSPEMGADHKYYRNGKSFTIPLG